MLTICGAKARRNNYKPCRQPAMSNGKCRLHGGKSTGPRTKEGKQRVKVANTKHGFYSAEAIAERKLCRTLIKASEVKNR
ncbi:MAG: hypothetical protein HKM07_06155 [Chlamydiae bacterium]|nr:hypothetical protein [Chlamydiota bacterium]